MIYLSYFGVLIYKFLTQLVKAKLVLKSSQLKLFKANPH